MEGSGYVWESTVPPPKQPAHTLYRRQVKSDWEGLIRPQAGLVNLGNSSYMNAVIQALFQLPAFVDWLMSERCTNKRQDCVTCTLQNLLAVMNTEALVDPISVLLLVPVIIPKAELNSSLDAFQFLYAILEKLHSESIASASGKRIDFWSELTTPVFQLFGIVIGVNCTCLYHDSGRCFLCRLYVECTVHASSVQEALNKYFEQTSCTPTADGCCLGHSHFSKILLKLPPLLIIKLKRFEENGSKILRSINVNLDLKVGGNCYHLRSIVQHSGLELARGFYSTLVKEPDASMHVHFDPSKQGVSVHTFLHSSIYKENSYILIYVKTRVTSKGRVSNVTELVKQGVQPMATVKQWKVTPHKKSNDVPDVHLGASHGVKPTRSLLKPRNLEKTFHTSENKISVKGIKPMIASDSSQGSAEILIEDVGAQDERPRTVTPKPSIGVPVNIEHPIASYMGCKHMPESKFLFFTGLSQINFNVLYNFLGGDEVIQSLKIKYKTATPQKKFQKLKIPLKDRLFMTLLRLRRGVPVVDLAHLFNISTAQVSNIFYVMIRHMSLTFKHFQNEMFISTKAQEKHKPSCFKKFKNLRVILDGAEFKIERPSNLAQQTNTFSNYKHSNTVKFIIGISCQGAVIFISPGYEGCISDKDAVLRSGLLQRLEKGDKVMTDRGFEIAGELLELGVELIKPPSMGDRKQLSPEEVIWTHAIAEARIYVEHVIGKIKQNRLLRYTIPIKLLPCLEDMVYTAACLVNFSKVPPKK